MIFELAMSGACCAAGLAWGVNVAREEGWNLLNPTSNWDKKIDVALALGTVAVTLFAGPVKGIMMTFLSLSFSIMIRVQKWLGKPEVDFNAIAAESVSFA